MTTTDIRRVDRNQNIYICDLLADDGTVLASDRYFTIGDQPFEELTDKEVFQLVLGLDDESVPDESWLVADIKAWMDDCDPPIAYTSSDLKADLLNKIYSSLET